MGTLVGIGQEGRLAQRYNSVWNILEEGIMCDYSIGDNQGSTGDGVRQIS